MKKEEEIRKILEDARFLIVTENGVAGSKGVSQEEVIALLLYGFLRVWGDTAFEVDVVEAGKRILATLEEMREEEDEEEDDPLTALLRKLFAEEEEDGET